MSEGIDEAAAAFDREINPTPAPPPAARKGNGGPPANGPEDRVFRNIGDVEVDDESPTRGGGDDEEDPEALIYTEEQKTKSPQGPDDGDEQDDEGADDDGDGEGDEGGEEGDDGDNDAFLAQDVQVVVDGEERTVKMKEALEGYVRTETFHKRLNEVDEAKKIVQRAAADAVQNYHYSMQIAQEMEAHLDAMIPKEPNWDEEFQKNPTRARELQKYYEQVKGFRGKLREQISEAAKKQAESDRVQVQAFAEAESAKFNNMNSKNWATDPKKKGKDLQAMRRTALTHGFSEDEISQVYDSRMLMVLLKASKYDRMMAARPKPVVRNRSKPIAPGAGSAKQRTAQRGVSSAMKRLNKTGSIQDAAMVFDEIIRRG